MKNVEFLTGTQISTRDGSEIESDLTYVTTGPLERSNCRVHLRGRCRDLLTDAVLTLE
jgi:hypothetical protein